VRKSQRSYYLHINRRESPDKYLPEDNFVNAPQDMNIDVLKRDLCGDGKHIRKEVVESLENEIEIAKQSKNKPLKKILKRRCVTSLSLSNSGTNL
jgi:hypothetical protein